ncbi:MAG TPA: type II secretion system major pseudopilin GspG [Bacillota bacterium]|nr:type II secretion system major pseudopilin GspG [Bacillota bacterium]
MKIKPRAKRNNEKGFTIVEILAVITLIGFLLVLVVPSVVRSLTQGRIKITQNQIAATENIIVQYYTDCGTYPTTEQGLKALVEKPSTAPEGWSGPYVQKAKTTFTDGWSRPLKYICPGNHNPDSYDLYSLGANGIEGGSGADADLGNW